MRALERAWYSRASWLILLWPLALLFQLLCKLRRGQLQKNAQRSSVPLIVVGNISVGGTGKTPMIIALAAHLKEQGYRPGIVSRGYGSEAASYPHSVQAGDDATISGDEALVLAERCECPVVIGADRNACVSQLLSTNDCDVILSDDGLQHYSMARDIEIAMIDGNRGFANGLCLPAGPLREPVSRLTEVDFLVVNSPTVKEGEPDAAAEGIEAALVQQGLGGSSSILSLSPTFFVNLHSGEKKPYAGAPFNMGACLQVVSAIGNPQRFYALLDELPYEYKTLEFPDHHSFSENDFENLRIDPRHPVVMTEKDAVKCRRFARDNFWYLSVDVELESAFLAALLSKLESARADRA